MLSWNVWLEDTAKKTIIAYDVFKGGYWQEIINKLMHESINKAEFAEKFKAKLKYQYWSRSEYEISLTSWPAYVEVTRLEDLKKSVDFEKQQWGTQPDRVAVPLTVARKIDIYEQLLLNWDPFINYVWENA